MEQKVVLRNGAVISYMRSFFEHCGYPASDEFVFPISYGSVLRWVKRLSELLGAKSLQLTTHTLRRSGASELSRQGMPLADILLYGRWLSEKAAREYIRKGEVAIIRSRGLLQVEDWARIDRWSAICNNAWKLYHQGWRPFVWIMSPVSDFGAMSLWFFNFALLDSLMEMWEEPARCQMGVFPFQVTFWNARMSAAILCLAMANHTYKCFSKRHRCGGLQLQS